MDSIISEMKQIWGMVISIGFIGIIRIMMFKCRSGFYQPIMGVVGEGRVIRRHSGN